LLRYTLLHDVLAYIKKLVNSYMRLSPTFSGPDAENAAMRMSLVIHRSARAFSMFLFTRKIPFSANETYTHPSLI